MNKIIQVINTMISNSNKITNVLVNGSGEYFFIYNDKYKWSILENNQIGYSLFLYPDSEIKLETLAFDTNYSSYKSFVRYGSDEFKSTEAIESFKELYNVVKDKIFGVDQIFEEIIGE